MNNLLIVDWTANDLKQARIGLGLTMKEVGKILDVAPQTVQRWEDGRNNNPMVLRMYGIFLERYYAAIKGYVPGYRKIGENTFIFSEDLKYAPVI